jgi:WD40 repeat protein
MARTAHLATIALLLISPAIIAFAQESQPTGQAGAAPQKVTFVDHVLPIFRNRCGSCHNSSDQSGSLVLDGYAGVMAGGSSGQVVTAGDVASSRLWKAITHEAEPFMPQGADKLPDAEIAVIREWIQQGLLEKSSSVAKLPKKTDIDRIEVSDKRPVDVAMPTAYLGEAPRVTQRPNAVTALAVSPWAPLLAVSGQEQVGLYSTLTLLPWGFLPFPEGQPQVLKFSRSGALLLIGGGHNAASGRVVVCDVKTGRRMIEVGDEYDSVLAADISPDHTLIALGGPKRLLRIYSAASGELVHEIRKHTDWVTAIKFSPDGVLLASADRSSGLHVWESHSGNLFHDLPGHRAAVTDVSWRPDSNVLVSVSEDSSLKLWGMEEGNQIKSWNVPGGVTAVEFVRDGRLVSTGRDQRVRLWQQDGNPIREFPPQADIGLEVAFDAETERVFGGDWSGVIHVWDAAKGDEVGQLTTSPRPLADEIRSLESRLAEAETAPTPDASAAPRPNESVNLALRAHLSVIAEAVHHADSTTDSRD